MERRVAERRGEKRSVGQRREEKGREEKGRDETRREGRVGSPFIPNNTVCFPSTANDNQTISFLYFR